MKSRITALLILIFLLPGCANLPDQQSSKTGLTFTSISVNEDVTFTSHLTYDGPETFSSLGLLGALTSENERNSTAYRIEEHMKKNNIDVGKVIRNTFITELNKKGLYTASNISDYKLQLAVLTYGLSIPHGFSTELVPVLSVQATIKDNNNQAVWKGGKRLLPSPLSPVKSRSLAELLTNNDSFISLWQEAARHIASNSIGKL
ncbi:MAG: hypothetical protein ABW088_15305 [Sedimenticola sp.]